MAKEEPKQKDQKVPPARQVPPGPPPRRPLIASILAIIIIIVGLLTLILGAAFAISFGVLAGVLIVLVPQLAPGATIAFVVGAIVALVGIVLLAIGFGLWKMRKWALYMVAIPVVLYVAIVGVSAALGAAVGAGFALLCAPVPIIAIVLLLYFVSIRKRFI